jgi:hypothetical protein
MRRTSLGNGSKGQSWKCRYHLNGISSLFIDGPKVKGKGWGQWKFLWCNIEIDLIWICFYYSCLIWWYCWPCLWSWIRIHRVVKFKELIGILWALDPAWEIKDCLKLELTYLHIRRSKAHAVSITFIHINSSTLALSICIRPSEACLASQTTRISITGLTISMALYWVNQSCNRIIF